jgi:hypothetical protein
MVTVVVPLKHQRPSFVLKRYLWSLQPYGGIVAWKDWVLQWYDGIFERIKIALDVSVSQFAMGLVGMGIEQVEQLLCVQFNFS